MKNVMVIGGTSFIGSHLVEKLSQEGYKVRVLVRKQSDTNFIQGLKKIELCLGDILDLDSLKKALEGIDTVFCSVNVKPGGLNFRQYHNALERVHVEGVKNLIEACKCNKTKRFFYLSSMSATLYEKNLYTLNEFSIRDLHNVYGRVKLEAENLLRRVPEEELGVTIFRPPEVFGERGPGALARYILFIKNGVIPVLGSIKNTHNIAYVGNIADQIIFLSKQDSSKGKQYIISDEKPYMESEIIETVCRSMNARPLKLRIPGWFLYCGIGILRFFTRICLKKELMSMEESALVINGHISSGFKILHELGYRQRYDLQAAVARTINWYKIKK